MSFSCALCSKLFSRPDTMVRHCREVHAKRERYERSDDLSALNAVVEPVVAYGSCRRAKNPFSANLEGHSAFMTSDVDDAGSLKINGVHHVDRGGKKNCARKSGLAPIGDNPHDKSSLDDEISDILNRKLDDDTKMTLFQRVLQKYKNRT